jgi:lysophospholipase L1-like esterase
LKLAVALYTFKPPLLMKRVIPMKILSCSHVLLFALLLQGTVTQAVAQSRPDTVPVQVSHYMARLATFRKAPVTTGKILFFGDDAIEKGNWRKLLKDSSVVQRGISGDNTFGLLNRLDEVARFKPSRLFLLVGANDLARGVPVARVLENLFTTVGQLHARTPSTQVLIISLLPVNPTMKNFPALHPADEQLRELNGQLKKYQEVIRYTFVDVYGVVLDQQNNLNASYSTDGIHLNLAGYQAWVEHLKKQKFL